MLGRLVDLNRESENRTDTKMFQKANNIIKAYPKIKVLWNVHVKPMPVSRRRCREVTGIS